MHANSCMHWKPIKRRQASLSYIFTFREHLTQTLIYSNYEESVTKAIKSNRILFPQTLASSAAPELTQLTTSG